MRGNKNKNYTYGTFLTPSRRFSQLVNKKIIVGLFVLLIAGGIGAAVFKHTHKPKVVAETKTILDSGIPGWWLKQYFNESVCDKKICAADQDPDQDKLTNLQEYYYHSNPLNPHTVQDAFDDGQMVAAGFDPSKPGRVTFEQVASPDNILGESLVFDQEIKQLVAESNDISKVNLPTIKDDELQIVYAEDADTYNNYTDKMQIAVNRYFRKQDLDSIKELLKSGSDADVNSIKIKAEGLVTDLKSIPVPYAFLMFHKYHIVMFQLLSEILPAPLDLTSAESDIWYEKLQAFLAVQQKLDFEKQFLSQRFSKK